MATLTLHVEDFQAQPLDGATASVRQGGARARKMKPTSAGRLELAGLAPGEAEVRVGSGKKGLQAETLNLSLATGHNTVTTVLGKQGQPFYNSAEGRVYFEPDHRRFLLVVRGEDAASRTTKVLKQRKLKSERLPAVLGQPGDEQRKAEAADSFYAAVRLAQGSGDAEKLMAAVRDELARLGLNAIVALPVARGKSSLQGLTGELVVRFEADVSDEGVQEIAREYGLRVLRTVAYAGNAFLLSRPGPPSYDVLAIADRLQGEDAVVYAEPNLLQRLELDQYTPNDVLWPNLTHLPLIGCDDAWATLDGVDPAIRGGSEEITIAVFDPHGVAPDHPDLTATLGDGTSKLVQSFNFAAMTAQTVPGLGGDHGTECAGTATAAFDNSQGIAGVAPNCHLIGARLPSPATGIEMADAFVWATGLPTGNPDPAFPSPPARPADVISNSWGVSYASLSAAMRDALDFLTVYGRGGRGCVVTFSIGNLGYGQFSNVRRFAAYERTVAVGASINANPTTPVSSFHADPNGNTVNVAVEEDTRALYSPYGPELDIVAPSHTAYAAAGGALIDPTTSSVRVGTGGLDGCPGAAICLDYDTAFGGTSHASPTVAGAAALLLSLDPGLSWVEVREVLRSTAVRIDAAQANAIGQWVDNDGDGIAEFSQWYGYGRLDVNAAVTAVRDRSRVADIVVRDNLGDSGAVPSTGWHAHSPDIWVRRSDDAVPLLSYASEPPHQKPRRGQDNYVYCRVKNVGGGPSNEVYVRAMITHFPGFEFRYPEEFTPSNRPGEALPSPLARGTYLIGESRLDGIAPGGDAIVKMTWPEALVPPATVTVGGATVNWHPCLLLEASPHDGPAPAGATFDIKRDNNIAQRNIGILDADDPASDLFSAVVAGTSDGAGVKSLVLDRSFLSADSRVFVRVADPKAMGRLIEWVKEYNEGGEEAETGSCRVELLNESRVSVECCDGSAVVLTVPRGGTVEWDGHPRRHCSLEVASHQGLEAVEVGAASGPVEFPLRLGGGELSLVLVAIVSADGAAGELRLTQRRGDGELSAGYTIVDGG